MNNKSENEQQLQYIKEELEMVEKIIRELGPKTQICECCFSPNPSTDQGYTTCCNELVYSASEMKSELIHRQSYWQN